MGDERLKALATLRPSDLMWGARPEWAMDPGIGCVWPDVRLAGRAITVRAHGSIRPGLALLNTAKPGEVLVIDAGGDPRAMLGDVACRMAARRGARGIVIDGAVRDIAEIRHLRFPVFARSHWIVVGDLDRTVDYELNQPITCGGVTVHAGDYLVGDDDGVVVVPKRELGKVVDKALARQGAEAHHRADPCRTSLNPELRS